MKTPQPIVIASTNTHKLKEYAQLLSPLGLKAQAAHPDWLAEAEEVGHTFVENALIKARAVSQHTECMVLADDSGLVVEALSGAPGVYSARYAGEHASDQNNNAKLLAELADSENRSAYFYCAIAVMRHPDDPCPLITTGQWHGEIAQQASGQSGFGYDPLFIVRGRGKTAAELPPEQKNVLSHRGRATRSFLIELCESVSQDPTLDFPPIPIG